jgi:hypothetical protein
MDTIDELYNTLYMLKSNKYKLDSRYINNVKKQCAEMIESLTELSGEYLHKIEENNPCEQKLENMIDIVPSSLTYKNELGQLPIQSAVWYTSSAKYIPFLAAQGVKHGVGQRGGLLVSDPCSEEKDNVLQLLACLVNDDEDHETNDSACLNILQRLEQSNLFLKQDIQDYDLLYWSCHPTFKLRFEYFARMNPGRLKQHRYQGKPIFHANIIDDAEFGNVDCFHLFFNNALKYYPNEIGLLFQNDDDGHTAFHYAIENYGKEATFNAIEKCVPLDGAGNISILHRVVEHAPEFLNDFAKRYPSSIFVRDKCGRKLYQSELASGNRTFGEDSLFFLRLSDDQVSEIDPRTALFPFMVAASDQTSDLPAVYYLLKKNPSLLNCSLSNYCKL